MQKVILISVIFVTVLVPALAARERNSRRALQKMLAWTVLGIALYVLSLLFVYPHLF